MIPVRLAKETPLRATVRILAWILFVITGITLIALSILSNNRKTFPNNILEKTPKSILTSDGRK